MAMLTLYPLTQNVSMTGSVVVSYPGLQGVNQNKDGSGCRLQVAITRSLASDCQGTARLKAGMHQSIVSPLNCVDRDNSPSACPWISPVARQVEDSGRAGQTSKHETRREVGLFLPGSQLPCFSSWLEFGGLKKKPKSLAVRPEMAISCTAL